IQIGDRFLYSNNYNAALYQYKKAQQKEIYNPVILTRIGKVYFLLKKYDEAKSVLERCIIANPNFVSAYELLLKVYYEKGEYENALQIYRHILEINPFNHEIRKIVGSIYSDLGRLKDAIREYEVVSILDPSDSKTRVVLDSIKRYLELKNLPKQ
ncbi:MAG: tetratricopeptide repeat protein, partial [Endomicrobia bacterium]|nr:tetratricopeptide repeat protein [Endomicrobiia bacterium]